jgi:hypothetical protein
MDTIYILDLHSFIDLYNYFFVMKQDYVVLLT